MAAFSEPYLSRQKKSRLTIGGFSSHLCARRAGKVQTSDASDGGFQRHQKKKWRKEKETNLELLQRVFKQDMFIKRAVFLLTYSKTSD